jgi:ketosteroid isomerase-like protein
MASHPVVTELAFRPRRLATRTLDERLAVRVPRLLGLIARWVTRLPLRSRLRRYLVERRTCQGFQAVNRGDLDLLLSVYHEDVTTCFDESSGFVPIDLVGEHRGREGFRLLFQSWQAAWNDLHVEPRELIDAGDRLIVTVEISGTGKDSGVPSVLRYVDVYTLRDGLISRHDMFADRADALAATGVMLD